MDDYPCDQLLAALARADSPHSEPVQVQAWQAGIRDAGACLALIEQAGRGRPCPRCGGVRIHRCGHASGLQRFRCLGCRRSYNALTGTPLARLRKRGHWLPYLQCVLDSRSVRNAAAVTGVHRTTSFRWRHRFVPGAARDRPALLAGVVEARAVYLPASQKGEVGTVRPGRHQARRAQDCLLVACDRSGRTLDFHTGRGPLTAAQLDACMRPALSAATLLVSDGMPAYRCFAQRAGMKHAAVDPNVTVRERDGLHLMTVNGWHARFKAWAIRFRGVASRYLSHYSGWQRVLDAQHLATPSQLLHAAAQRS
jgi:transposase-like protein